MHLLRTGTARTRRISTLLAFGLAAVALLPLLGAKPLTDWDEAIYAEVAREMLRFGWLVPHWNYQPWLEKPPLAMWLTAAMYRLFGVNEFAARACSALSGVGTVALLHLWLVRTRSLLAAWLSTVILLGTFGFLHSSHTGEVDTLLAFTCTLAVMGLAMLPASPKRGWLLFWFGFALAAMTKGAASAVLLLTAVTLVAIFPRTTRIGRHAWLGLALFLVLVLPWHLFMLHRFGHEFVREYLGFHVLARSMRQIEGHQTHWWFYAKVLLVAAPPFALLYPAAAIRGLRRTESSQLRPWAVFSLVTLGFYTLVQTRLPQYIVPAYPALTLLTAIYLEERLQPLLEDRRPMSFWIKGCAATAVVSAVVILATAPERRALHSAVSAAGAGPPPLDSKDSAALLRRWMQYSPAAEGTTPGALLLWRPGPVSSIATDIFYARRAVLQVQLPGSPPIPPDQPLDRYTFDTIPLDPSVLQQPSLILLDRTLVPLIPASFTYTPLASHGGMELARIAPAPESGR